MIISASRRTDLPAFHAAQFASDLKNGFTQAINPFRPSLIKKVSLNPADVDAIFFWTRNPAPMLPYLPMLKDKSIPAFFLVTITGYPGFFEPGAPKIHEIENSLALLAASLGREQISWRYDPIIFSPTSHLDFHLENFSRLLPLIAPFVSRIIFALFHPYRRALIRLHRAGIEPRTPSIAELSLLGSSLAAAAETYHLPLQSCALPPKMTLGGIPAGKCIDETLLKSAGRIPLPYKKDPGQRKNCLCHAAVDIGSYRTCAHGCLYCYAN